MGFRFLMAGWVLGLGGLLAGNSARGTEVRVFAAASLSEVLTELGKSFTTENGSEKGTQVLFNFAASSTLARQIKEGARADVFLSADRAKVDDLDAAGLLEPGSGCIFASNTLALVVRTDSELKLGRLESLTDAAVRRIAIAQPDTVPAGIYAREFLQREKLWDALQSKIVATENVRTALAVVEQGNADVAIVYRTDALLSDRVKIARNVAKEAGPDIAYAGAALKDARNADGARRFLEYLRGPEGRAAFSRFGFLPAR